MRTPTHLHWIWYVYAKFPHKSIVCIKWKVATIFDSIGICVIKNICVAWKRIQNTRTHTNCNLEKSIEKPIKIYIIITNVWRRQQQRTTRIWATVCIFEAAIQRRLLLFNSYVYIYSMGKRKQKTRARSLIERYEWFKKTKWQSTTTTTTTTATTFIGFAAFTMQRDRETIHTGLIFCRNHHMCIGYRCISLSSWNYFGYLFKKIRWIHWLP